MSILTLDGVSKSYADSIALADLSLDFQAAKITALIGRSGCGKSSLLKMCNGLVRPDCGTVSVFGEPMDYAKLPAMRRRIGYALQGTGLFPHLSIAENISLLATLEQWSAEDIRSRLDQLLELVQLQTNLLSRYPHELSGGQQQRVGLCRAMMLRPQLLLLDEPFAAIDPLTRMDIHEQMLALHHAEPVTTILVTHDMKEALLLADHIVVMDAGKVVVNAAKQDILDSQPEGDANQLLLSLMPRVSA